MRTIKGRIVVETVSTAKPDVTITMPWEVAVKVSKALGGSALTPYDVYDALSEVVDPRYNGR